MAQRRTLDEDLGFLMSRASAVLVKATNRGLAPLGLKVRAYSVLVAVCDESAGITQRRLAADIGLDPSQIVALVDDLEQRGLVNRTTDPEDRRNKLVLATDAGRGIRQKAGAISDAVAREHLGDLSAGQLDDLRAVLHRMVFADAADVAG